MKPYQLLGLSFLVYLHKNGLSGILGDEMGLGKTLQTLSLVQYLKENRKLSASSEALRPCLVVCPLSVSALFRVVPTSRQYHVLVSRRVSGAHGYTAPVSCYAT